VIVTKVEVILFREHRFLIFVVSAKFQVVIVGFLAAKRVAAIPADMPCPSEWYTKELGQIFDQDKVLIV
jgi:hypothetical protein